MRPFTGGDDPRRLGGDIVDPGGPPDPSGTIVDTRNAVLADYSTVTVLEATSPGGDTAPTIALLLEGRINLTPERARVLFLLSGETLAALISELLAVGLRAGGDPNGVVGDILDRLTARRDLDSRQHP